MLIFFLKKEWFEKIKAGTKTIEYREVKPYWEKRLKNIQPGTPCQFRLGYTKTKINATITKIEIVPGLNTDLQIDTDVYAIHFKKENS